MRKNLLIILLFFICLSGCRSNNQIKEQKNQNDPIYTQNDPQNTQKNKHTNSFNDKNVTYKIGDYVFYETTTSENEIVEYDWIYVENYMQFLVDEYHYLYKTSGTTIDCILNVKWNKVEDNNNIIMNAEVKSILRAGIFDVYNYSLNTDDILISGIIYSDDPTFVYPEFVYRNINNEIVTKDSFRFVDFELLEFEESLGELIYDDVDVNTFIVKDANQLVYCNSEINKIVIPEQYTKNKSIPGFLFSNKNKLDEIEISGDVGQINPNAFVDSAYKITIKGNIKNIEPLGFVSGCEITINGNIENYNKYSFYKCDKINYDNGIFQVLDYFENKRYDIGLFIEFKNSYNLSEGIKILYTPYVDTKFEYDGDLIVSYNVDNKDNNSNIVESIILDDNLEIYRESKINYNQDYYLWSKFVGREFQQESLKEIVITESELSSETGILFFSAEFIDEDRFDNLIYICKVLCSLKYEIIDDVIYLQYNDVVYSLDTI